MAEKIVKDSQGLAKDLVNDCISRKAAIERATKDHDFYKGATTPADMARRDELLNVMCWLGELPSAQPEPRWIPCSEKAAEYPCLACDVFGQIFITDGGIVKINGECYDGTGFDFSNADEFLKGEKVGNAMRMLPRKIVAWLPLPEPYREVE